MQSRHFAVATSSGENHENMVPYFGRNGIVVPTDLTYQNAVETLIEASTNISKIAASKNNQSWISLSEELAKFSHGFLDPGVPIRRFQLDLLVESVLPYLKDVKSQIHTQPARFSQIQSLLQILSGNDMIGGSSGGGEGGNHPCHSLLKIETIIHSINREGGLWKSKLSTGLEQGVRKQWAPIVADHQRALMNIGSKLCMLGLVEAVGRPIIMLYPLFIISQEALKIAAEFEVKKKLSASSLFQIVKMIAMLLGVGQVLGILSMYAGLGYTCLALGCGALFISSTDELTKASVPVLAPNMASISMLLDHLYKLEKGALNALNNLNAQLSTSAESSSTRSSVAPTSDRVEELPPDVPATATAPAPAPVPRQLVQESLRVSHAGTSSSAENSQPTWSDSHPDNMSSNEHLLEEELEEDIIEDAEDEAEDYIFAELDVYACLTQATLGSEVIREGGELRQRRHT